MTISEKLKSLENQISLEMSNNDNKFYGSLNRIKKLMSEYRRLKDGLDRLSEDEEREISKPEKFHITESKLNFDDKYNLKPRKNWL